MLAFPVLLMTTDFDDVPPTEMLPKFNDVGFKVKSAEAGAVALAFSVKEVGEFVALLTTFKLPKNVPAV